MTTQHDYSAYQETENNVDVLSQLSALAEAQAMAEARVATREAELAQAQRELADIAEKQIPELMDSVNLEELTTAAGLKIDIKENIRAAIPKDRRGEAAGWLKDHQADNLIKREVSVQFAKGEFGAADLLIQLLEGEAAKELQKALGHEVEFTDDTSVHPSTLSSWVREKLEAGIDIPQDLFGVFRQRYSKISVPKKKGRK